LFEQLTKTGLLHFINRLDTHPQTKVTGNFRPPSLEAIFLSGFYIAQ